MHANKDFLTIFKNTDRHNNLESTPNKEFFTIPYIKSIAESFKPVVNKYGFHIAYTIPNTLRSFIKCGKDDLDSMSHQGVVYKISCHDCDAPYIGQTKRQLRTRIKEHNLDIKKKIGSPSVISEHRNFNHDFGWDNIKILDNERSYQKRLISEMVHIKKQPHGLNKQSDINMLPKSYFPIIDLFSPF